MSLCVPVCVQEMFGCWRMWAERWCSTGGPSCHTQSIPANAKAPAMRRRCSSTPAWLVRTVLRGFCSTAPNTQHHTTVPFLIHIYTHTQAIYVCLCMSVSLYCQWKCFLLPLPVVSPWLAPHRLKQCNSHSLFNVCSYVCMSPTGLNSLIMFCSRLFHQLTFVHQWILQNSFSLYFLYIFWFDLTPHRDQSSPFNVILMSCFCCFIFIYFFCATLYA